MENLIINGTKVSPDVVFQMDGKLRIEGKIITENAVLTFAPIFQWISGFEGHNIEFDIILEYMNTSASMQLFALLNQIDANNNVEDFKVNWFYDQDDEEHFETGEMFEDRLERTKFNYIVVEESKAA
jgi:hypothetical protein